MTKNKSTAFLLLGLVFAGCVTVRSPEKVQFSFGGDDDESSPPSQPDRSDSGSPAKSRWLAAAADVGSTVVGEGTDGFIFLGCDVLTTPGRKVKLTARVKAYTPGANVEGITLAFYRLQRKKSIGSAMTDKEGYASISFTPKKAGDYRFCVKIAAVNEPSHRSLLSLPAAFLLVSAKPAKTKFVVVDLDRTLVASSIFRVVLWDGGKPYPGSQRVMQRIAKTYSLIYLTQRPSDLTRTSRLWLEEQGYPEGVLMLGSANGMLGDGGKEKSQQLRRIRKEFPQLRVGIGDRESDVIAYRENGMKAIWIPRLRDKSKDMRKLAAQMRQIRDPKIIVVENWRQIGEAIFGDYRCPPAQFADMLEARTQELRKHEQDEDDD